MKPSEAPIIFILGTLTLMVFVVFVVLIVVEYRRRQVRSMREQLEQEHRHERELIQTKADVEREMLETEKVRLEDEVAIRTAEVVAQKEEIERHNAALQQEKKKSDDLLLNILPAEVAEELKEKGRAEARFFDNVTVLFTDFVDFTTAAERMSPQELVDELDVCFKAFDRIVRKYGCEKIKTIGDAYLAVCGLPHPDAAHAEHIAMCALEMVQFMAVRKLQPGTKTFDIRVGIHSGSVVAGIVGLNKFAYDIWGDTVNTAARMEQNSEPGRINISQVTYELVKDRLGCTYRGEIEAKHKGKMKMYFVG
jgi:adenylate cyclase